MILSRGTCQQIMHLAGGDAGYMPLEAEPMYLTLSPACLFSKKKKSPKMESKISQALQYVKAHWKPK